MASWRSGKSSKKSSSLFFSFYPVLAIIIGLVLWWTLSDVKFPKFSKRASHTKIENKKEKTSNLQPEQSPDDYSKIDDTICLLGKKPCELPLEYESVIGCFHSSNIYVYYYRTNGSCDHCEFTPGFVFPTSTEETSAVVKCLADNPDVAFRVRSGAHSFSGSSFVERGFIVDMKRMRRISVMKGSQQVVLGVGNRVGEVFQALKKHNFLLIGGDCPDVGIGGLSSTGGTGFSTRKYGLMINTVRNYEIVTVSGKAVNASFKENTDLFDALRGSGGSSFGVITHVTFKVETLDPHYGFLRFEVAKSSMAEWLHYFFSVAHTLTEDVMYLYTYLTQEGLLIQGALTGKILNSPTKGLNIMDHLVEEAKKRNVNVVSHKLYQTLYQNLYKFTYGEGSLQNATGYKSTKARDFRVSGNSHYSGMMSGYVCGENIPIEALEELEDHFISYPDLEDSDFGVNIELFGGRSFPDEYFGVYSGKGCRAIITTFPANHEDPEKLEHIREFQRGFWNIIRPHTNYSYRGYEDLSEGQWDGGQGVKGLMNLHYSEENKQRVMRVKSKYDPGNLFKNHMSVPTLDCYNNGNCS